MYKTKIVLFILIVIIASIPFFWLKPGGMDLGGDSSRLYFYDPIHYLTSFGLYAISPDGVGSETIGYYLIPFVFTLALLKYIFSSSLLITLFNSFSLVVAFLSIYGIIVTFLGKMDKKRDVITVSLVGIIGGFFYIFSPILIRTGWDRALFNHNQFFLNPFLFYLLLLYVLRQEKYIMGTILLVSFVFTANFSPSPYFFSFFPLALFYLIIYAIKVKHTLINIKQLVVFSILFILIHAFHLFPFVTNLLSTGSSLNQSAFSEWGKYDRGLGYFLGIESTTIVTNNLLGIVQGEALRFIDFVWILFPVLLVLGLLASRKMEGKREQRINFLLLFLFFLLVLFFASAKITFSSLALYKMLFFIPGFSMFRNYVGQFSHVLVFFYTLILSFSLFFIFSFLRKYWKKITISIFLLTIITISAFPFIKGDMINTILNKGTENETTPVITIPSVYDDVLSYIRNNKTDGKYISFPLDDYGYQILAGKDGGLYVGPPSIAYLAEKNHFSGAGDPFGQLIIELTRKKDYIGLQNLFTLYNIRYIFYNSDIHIYNNTFAGYPYAYVKKFMPATQELYMDFINQLPVKSKRDFGELYHIYEVKNNFYVPHIFVAKKTYYTNIDFPYTYISPMSFMQDDKRIAFSNDKAILNRNTLGINGLFLQAKKETNITNVFSKKPDSLTITNQAPPQLYAILHPFLVIPEKTVNNQVNEDQKIYLDKAIYASEKILQDIENKGYATDIWETKLKEYDKSIYSLVDQIENKNNPLYPPTINKTKLASIANWDENRFYVAIVHDRTLNEQEKTKLIKIENETFISLYRYISNNSSIQNTLEYSITPSEEGSYEVFLEKSALKNLDKEAFQVIINGNKINPLDYEQQDYWIKLGTVIIDTSQRINLTLTLPDFLIGMDKTFFDAIKNPSSTKYVANFKAEGLMLQIITNIISDFSDWKENSIYLMSFDYQENPIIGSPWKMYRTIIETGNDLTSARMVILGDPNNPENQANVFFAASNINIKNVSVIGLPFPTVLFKKNYQKKETVIPKIIFRKINPTKYEVKVSNAKDPYTLVFLDGFNKKWKVFVSENKSKDKKILGTYFNGDINEGFQENSFFNTRIFETWGNLSIAEGKHYMVNGYANAWDIDPKDVGGKGDYTLIIEFETQRVFYILFFISCITAGTIGIALIAFLQKYLYRFYSSQQ